MKRSQIQLAIEKFEAQACALETEAAGLRKIIGQLRAVAAMHGAVKRVARTRKAKAPEGETRPAA